MIPIVSFFLGACAGSSTSNGTKLSEAMRRASDDNHGSRSINTPHLSDRDTSSATTDVISTAFDIISLLTDTGTDTSYSSSLTATPSPKKPSASDRNDQQTWFSLAGGTGVLNHRALYGLNHFEARLGFDVPEWRGLCVALAGGIDWAPVQQTSNLARSLDGGIMVLNGRIRADWHTTPPYTFLGQYFFLGGGYSYMMWDYSNAIIVNGRHVSGDALEGLDLFGGIGLNLMQTRNFRLGGELTPGVILWMPTTSEGFDNDVFESFPYLKFTAVVSVGG